MHFHQNCGVLEGARLNRYDRRQFQDTSVQSIEYIMGFCPAYDFFIGSLTAQAGSFFVLPSSFPTAFSQVFAQASSSSGLRQSCLRTGTNQHADSWDLLRLLRLG